MSIQSVPAGVQMLHGKATRKAVIRLMPIIGLIYFMSYIDRTNVSLAKTELAADIGLSTAAFGLGAGLFFLTYALLEVPSNLTMYRVGPRVWITRIAVSWGAVSALMMFVQNEWSFYLLRLLLGAAEAGLFPALMYMVTTWFAQKDRAKVVGWIYLAPSIAMVIGGPVGGALMELDGAFGLHGWQWLFLIEGLATIAVGVFIWFNLPSAPRDAAWLTPAEAEVLERSAIGGEQETANDLRKNLMVAFGRPFIGILALVYFLNQIASAGIIFYTPAIIEDLNVSGSFLIGVVAGTAGIGAVIGALALPRLLGNLQNEAMSLAVPIAGQFVTATAFVLMPNATVRIILIGVAMLFCVGMLPLFWSIAMARMSGIIAAAGLALINTIGLIGGFVGPYLFGLTEASSGDPSSGMAIVIATTAVGLLLVPIVAKSLRREDARTDSTV